MGDTGSPTEKWPQAGPKLDWLFAGAGVWTMAGLYYDGWTHRHVPGLESFFTESHALLYTGILALGLVLGVAAAQKIRAGHSWRRALPVGYHLSALGVLLLFVGGPADMGWHLLFGIEEDLQALVSPTHLLLALGGGLVTTGQIWSLGMRLRAAQRPRWSLHGPHVIAVALLLSILTFFTQFAHPVVTPLAGSAYPARHTGTHDLSASGMIHRSGEYPHHHEAIGQSGFPNRHGLDAELTPSDSLGVAAILLQGIWLAGASILLVRQKPLPFGALTFLMTINIGAMAVLEGGYRFLFGAAATGMVLDFWLRGRTTDVDSRIIRTVPALLPGVFFATYFLTLHLSEGLGWPANLWLGSILMVTTLGWALGCLATSAEAREAT